MQTDFILANIAKHISLSEEEEAHFISLLIEKKIKKKDFLLDESQFCKHIYFVNSGTIRAFHLNKKGTESTIMFAIKDWWITDIFSFLKEHPAVLNIQAIETSSVLQLSKKSLDQLFIKTPKFEKFFRIIMQNAYIREQLRTIQNLSLTAEERYDNFVKKYPLMINHITQKQIASYLGVTPEFLSKMRARKRNN